MATTSKPAGGKAPAGKAAASEPASGAPASGAPASGAPASKKPAPKASASKTSGKLGVDVAILWRGDMLTASFFAKPRSVTIGPDGTFILPKEVIGKPVQPLIEAGTAAGFGLRIDNEKSKGHLIVDGDVHDVGDVRSGKVSGFKGPLIPLTAGTRAVLVFGDFTFIVSREPVPPPTRFSLWNKEMVPFLMCLLTAFLMTAGPLAAAFNSPAYLARQHLSFEEKQATRLSELIEIAVKTEPEPEPEPEEAKKEEEKPKAPELKPEKKKEEVKKEEIEVKKEEAKIDEKLDSVTDEEEKDKLVKKIVAAKIDEATADIDKALKDVTDMQIGSKMYAEGDDGDADPANPASGQGGATVLADPTGKTQGAGLMAAGRKKTAMNSGDATKRKVIKGLGKDKTAGKGVKIGMKTRRQKVVRVGGGSGSKASGELPKKVIQKYIRRKMGAIKACYQKGLQSNPNLSGKVQVLFLIKPSGAIAGAKVKDSSLNSSRVEGCILKNVKSWKFPRAKGGGTTKVLYPFRFTSR
ncbi:MAG: AgmX/PglI C-terminal domain-containing protein [Myxococcales bacterium]|nr:AgmX/PglI C-terminal domain-containing protein [Myxococcales bacterium]